MKYVAILLLVLAALGLVGLARVTMRHMDRSPAELLDEARYQLDEPIPDLRRALTELELALSGVQFAADPALEAEILGTRGEVYRRMGANSKARDDFLRVQVLDPTAPDLSLKLLTLDYASGENVRGLQAANALLEVNADDVDAQTFRGRFLVRIADERIEEALTMIEELLPDETSQEAVAIVYRLTGMDLEDPGRLVQVHKLRGMFPEQEEPRIRQLMRIVEEAARHVSDARQTLAASFSHSLRQDAISQYVDILDRAGYDHEAVQFGLAAAQVKLVGNDPPTMRHVIDALTAIGRPDTACDLIEERLSKRVLPNADFLRSWCQALMADQRWTRLVSVANKLKLTGTGNDMALASFYVGYAYAERENYRQAGLSFADYLEALDDGAPQPIHNVRGYIERALGRRDIQTGKMNGALEHLNEAVRVAPDDDGQAWVEIADAYAVIDPDDLASVEVSLTHAIRLMPERIPELLPRWRSIGEVRLGKEVGTLDQQFDSLRSRNLCTPPIEVGPYELFRLLELHKQQGTHACVIATAQRLLDDYPGFLPALDELIDSAIAIEDWPLAASWLLERLRHGGPHAPTQLKLASLPKGVLTPSQVVELMRLDPERTGRLALVRHLREAGEQGRALGGLLSMSRAHLRDDGRILAGDLLLDLGRNIEALGTLQAIDDTSPYYAAALHRRIRAAALAGSAEDIEKLLAELERTPLDRDALLAAVDDMWRTRLYDSAEKLLLLLDENPQTRDTDVLLRLGMNALLAGEQRAALESFDRAEAFDRTGQAALGRLLVAVQSKQWDVLPLYVRDLMATGFRTDTVGQIVLTALDERLDDASQHCAVAFADLPNDPLCYLVRSAILAIRVEPVEPSAAIGEFAFQELGNLLFGEPAYTHDPRQTLMAILVSRTPGWRGWSATYWQERGRGAEGSVWANYLAAKTLLAQGRLVDASKLALSTKRRWPQFRPIWLLYEEIESERRGGLDHPALIEIRQERRQAIGDQPGEEAEVALGRAYVLQRNGDLELALSEARKAVQIDPNHLAALRLLAALYEQTEQWREAMALYRDTALKAQEDVASELVEDYLGFLDRAHLAAPMSVPSAAVAAELEILSKHLPEDPLIALAQAREQLAAGEDYSYVRVRRAFAQLDAFRRTTRDQPLDQLRPGASRSWMQFYAKLDPRGAEDFVRQELMLDPGSLDLWILLGEALDAQGRWSEAIAHFELVLEMMPDSSTRRRLVRLLATYGNDRERLEEHVTAVVEMDGDPTDVEMNYYLALGLVNEGEVSLDRGLAMLEKLWVNRASTGELSHTDIGRAFGAALLLRGSARDRRMATAILLEVAPLTEDPIQRNLAVALGNLAASTTPQE